MDAADIPTFSGPRPVAASADAIRFRSAPGWMPRGRRAYVIGDVHGHRDKLAMLHAAIAQDMAARPPASAVLIHLGDYINQGPDGPGVLDLLCGDPPAPGLRVVNLLGDHERMLLDALDGDRAAATDWLWAGGRETLRQWGLPEDLPRDDWAASLPPHHLALLRGLVPSHRESDYLFVHAGIRPGVPLDMQGIDDLTTIRQPFLFTEQDFGVVVVHGHSTNPVATIAPNRIGLDTGAGMGDRLTGAVLEEGLIGLIGA
jgi:serine/threonine protein phosphatase 1